MKSDALHDALYAALTGDATLLSMLSSAWGLDAVFADVPQTDEAEDDAYYPFVSFGPETSTRFDDKDENGGNAVLQINAWTRTNNYTEAKQIADRIHMVLHKGTLSISGANHISTQCESVDFSIDPDGHTRRALMLYRVTYFDI